MSYIDSVLNGTYSQGNYKKKREQEKESYVDKVLNGTYEIGSYRSKKQEEVIQESNNKDLGLLGKFLKQGKEMEDGYQFGDVTKMVLGTGNDLIQKTTKGLLSPVESVLDIGTNLIASGLSTGSGALGIKNEKLANDLREFADKDLTAIATKTVENVNPIGMAYNIVNGTPQKIINPAEIEWDKEKNIFENYGAGLEKAWATDREEDYEKSSVAGEYTGKIAELVGHTLGLKLGGEMMAGNTAKVGTEKLGASISKGNIGFNLAGHTLNLPTLAIAGGMAGGLQEANSKENVNEAERWGKALSGGLMEGFTEGLFGMLGVGGNDVTEKLASKLASQFSSKAGKTLAQIGISASGEAAEEFLSYAGNFFIDNGIIDKLGEADFKAEWDWGEVGEQMALAFISSALTSGADTKISNNSAIEAAEQQLGRKLNRAEKAQVTQAMIDGTIQEKIDALNAYTDNETKVYDSLMNEKFNTRKTEIAKENEYNTKIEEQQNMLARDLTEQEQIQLRKEIDERFENEEISLDDIELTKEEMKEFAQSTQEDIESGNLSKDKIREILGENVDISNDRRLQKSYVQSHNKQTVYDYQKTDSVAKNAVMESAAKANMNNTEMSRNFVDYVSKISEDTGVTYRFANTGQLKQLGYTIEDKTVDGVVTKDGTIYINPQSKDAINYVLGHETTHLLESTQEYTKLQEMIVKYAQQKGIYEEALENIKSRYSNILETNEEFMQELTSDLSSRILFSDEAFIQELSVKEPNIFQKFYDFIKHTIKMATAGSKEAKQLEKIKYSFDKAYKTLDRRSSSKSENNRFSIQTDSNGNKYVQVDTDQNIFDGIDKKDYNKIAKMYMQDYLSGKTDLNNNDSVIIDSRSVKKYTNPTQKGKYLREKMQLTPELKNVLEIAQKENVSEPSKENSKYKSWEYYKFKFELNGKTFEGTLNIGVDNKGSKHFYEINKIHTTSNSSVSTNTFSSMNLNNNSITSTKADVNTTTKYSIQESENNSDSFNLSNKDNLGRTLSREQQEYFKDSKVKDENGNLKVVYHGTRNGNFTVFDKNKIGTGATLYSSQGKGFYFTDSNKMAQNYSGNKESIEKTNKLLGLPSKNVNPQIYEVYLDFKKPYVLTNNKDINSNKLLTEFSKNIKDKVNSGKVFKYEVYNPNNYNNRKMVAGGEILSNVVQDKYSEFTDFLISNGFDGIIYNSYSYDTNDFITNYVAFYPEQIKSINNTKPTLNPDIRYSISKNKSDNIYDEIVPEGNTYKVTAEDVKLEKASSHNSEELSNNGDTTADNIKLLEYLDKHKIDYEILENGEVQTNEVDLLKILDKIAESEGKQEGSKLRSKAVQYANKAKNKFVKQFTQDMNLNESINKQLILDTLNQVEQEINQNGKISNQRVDEIFNEMYSQLLESEGKYYTDTIGPEFEVLDRENFDRNLEPLINELKLADRYNKEEIKNNVTVDDVETLKEVYKQQTIKQKEYEKIMNKELLTQRDKAQIDRLINQEITIDELPSDVNKKGILNIYNIKKDLVELQRITQNHRKNVVTENRQLAKDRTQNISTWKDKSSGWKYQIDTMKRNLRDIIPNKAEAQNMYDTYFRPITKNNAQIEKSINSYNDRIEAFNINNQESTYIQMIGESKYNPESKFPVDMVEDFYNKHKNKIDKEKCNQAVEEFRAIYDELIEQINGALITNGYKPIEYREGYFPHFIEDKSETIIGKLAEKMGWKIKKDTLPTDIAGITDTFKPGKSWTSFSQQRTGDATDYNALKGFDNYVRGAMDVIYHTEDIQRLRALENEIRYQYSNEGIKEQIDNIYANNELDTQEKEIQINNLLDNIKNTPMGNLVTELKNYTNNLANKKATSDRGMEEFWGRQTYSIMSNVQNRVSANMVGANIASATTNFIPITQAWSQTSTKNIIKGLKESIATCFKDDGFANNSTFLVNRTQAADRLYKTGLDSINDKLGFMFDKVDEFTSNTIVRAKYYDNIEKGMSMQDAMNNADEFAKDVMAGRSKGDMPTVFNKKNPLVKLFTAFQLEVNNQYGYMFKDIPSDLADEGKGKLIGAFIKMFLGAFLYNKMSEEITGRKSAFSPIDIAIEGYATVANENMGVGEKVENIVGSVAGELPFVSGVVGGGRLPIQAALPDASEMISSASDLVDMNAEDKSKAIKTLGKELSKPLYYVALPFAGGQLKKTVEGLSMYSDDLPTSGSYTNSGKLRYTVNDDVGTKVKAAIFGQYAVKEAQEYFEQGYSPLTEKQTQELIELDIPISDYRKYKDKLKEIDKTKKEDISDETSKLQMKLDYISSLDLSDKQKNILINNVTTRKDKIDVKKYEEYNNLEEMDYAIKNPSEYKAIKTVTDFKTYNKYKEEISNIKKKYSSDTQKKRAVVDYINELPLETGQKAVMIKLNYTGIKDNNAIIVDYINNLDMEYDEKVAIFEKLGFKYKGGRIYE